MGCHVAFPTASKQVQKGLHSATEVSKLIRRTASTTPAPNINIEGTFSANVGVLKKDTARNCFTDYI